MRVVVAIAEYGSVARAASALHQSSSAVSRSLLLLERELGVPLFHRLPRGMALTDAGEHFLPAARRTLHEAVLAREETDHVRGLRTGRLTIAAARGFVVPLSKLVASFVHEYPAILTRVRPLNAELVVDSVRSGECDVGFTAAKLALDDVIPEPIYRLGIGVAVSADHRLAGRSAVSLHDLDGEPIVAPSQTSPYRQYFDARFDDAGIIPRVVVEAGTQEMMLELVRMGVGAALMPAVAAGDGVNRGGIVVLGLNPPVENTIVVVLPRNQRPTAAAVALFEMARRAYRPAS